MSEVEAWRTRTSILRKQEEQDVKDQLDDEPEDYEPAPEIEPPPKID